MELAKLLDSAKKVTGSDKATADALGVPFQRISDWRNGHRPAQPEDVALIASVAGVSATEALVEAVIKKHEGTKKGDLLQRALGKARGVVAMLCCGVVVAAAFAAGYSAGGPRGLFARR